MKCGFFPYLKVLVIGVLRIIRSYICTKLSFSYTTDMESRVRTIPLNEHCRQSSCKANTTWVDQERSLWLSGNLDDFAGTDL